MKISVLIGSRNRVHVLERCLKSVFLQDFADIEVLVLDDSDDPNEYNCLLEEFDDPRFQLLHSPEPLGVSGSRSKLMEEASGDVFVFIDDDAYFDTRDALSLALESFSSKPEVGILAFKIKNHGRVEREYNVPFNKVALTQRPHLIAESRFVGYFLGTAHAIRKEVIKECGTYNTELFFGEEELDLSYNIISHGWKIYYEAGILVHHVPQPSVVDNSNRNGAELFHHVKNRFYLAYRYIPSRYILPYISFWLAKYFVNAIESKAICEYISGIIAGIRWLRRINRNPLNLKAIRYLQSNLGRLWY